jgi:mannitol-1-/sugar-/sorbitol-6-/2-deoxyglucose-6-phosphatase
VIEAVVFDVDGVLIDSEPLWQDAEIEVFGALGVPLTRTMCAETMGLRIDEAVAYWHERFPWSGRPVDDVAGAIVARVVELVGERGEALPGVHAAVAACRERGLATAVASSSPMVLLEAVLRRLDLAFPVVRSAEVEPFGKPHPGIYLAAAAELGVTPTDCVAVEDSINGIVAAKAARMACVAVPDPSLRGDSRLGIADAVLHDLSGLSGALDRL